MLSSVKWKQAERMGRSPGAIIKRCLTRDVLLIILVTIILYLVYTFFTHDEGSSSESADKYYQEGVNDDERLSFFPKHYHEYAYLLNTPEKCKSDTVLLIGISSLPSNRDQRQAIRRTWASWAQNSTANVKVIFLFGRCQDADSQATLNTEAERNGDIVQQTFLDTYYNLTLKSLMLLHWSQSFCENAKYIMKTDDDVFVVLPNLITYVSATYRTNHLFGCLIQGAVPNQEKARKFYSGDFPLSVYPNYLSGTGYVMSQDAARNIYRQANKEVLHFLEDVFITGICATRLGIIVENHRGFHYEKREDDVCVFRSIVSAHKMQAFEMYDMWEKIQSQTNAFCMVKPDWLTAIIFLIILILLLIIVIIILGVTGRS